MSSEYGKYCQNSIDWLLTRHVTGEKGDKIAIINEHGAITYSDLLTAVVNLPSYLPQFNNIPKGSVIGCFFEDSISSAACILSLIYHGMVPCILNPHIANNQYQFYLDGIDARYVLTEPDFQNVISVYTDQEKYTCMVLKDKIDHIIKNSVKSPASCSATVSTESPAFCLYTSGTTGYPGAVLHRHMDIKILNENYGQSILGIKSSDCLFTTSKMFFAYGLNNLLFALYNGATAILSPKNNSPETIWSVIHNYNPSIIFSVPSMYRKLLAHSQNSAVSSVKKFISAGETLPKNIFHEWEKKFGKKIIDGIGSTETLSTFISNNTGSEIPGCTGKPVEGFQCAIKDRNNVDVGINQTGILWVKGETCSDKYLNNDRASHERFKDGWFITNDLFYADSENNYFYQGRVDDLIYKNGIWIFPSRIEERIEHHNDVYESILSGHLTDQGIILIAFLVVNNKPEKKDTFISDLNFINENHPHYQKEEKIDVYCIVDSIPKTPTGKIRRNEFKKSPSFENATQCIEKFGFINSTAIDTRKNIICA